MCICVLKTHLLSLIKKSVIERHNVISDANMVLYLQLEQLMCETDILVLSELPWEPQK